MKIRHLYYVLSLLVMISMVLTACAPQVAATTEAPAQTEAPGATEAPATAAATEAPTEGPKTDRHGGWLDEIDVSVVAGDSAVSQLQAGAIDIYSYGLASDVYPAIKDAGLSFSRNTGGSYSVMMNPAVFTDKTKLNPFSDRKVREALNWIIDRNYINQEIYAGGSLPKFFAITTQLVEYTDLIDSVRALESKYAFNLDKGKQIITDEMTGMGAELGADGKWQFNGKPITLVFLIRSDGDGTRKPMGDYISTQL